MHSGSEPLLASLSRVACAVAMALGIAPAAAATQGQLCLDAAHRAASAHDIPEEVLVALTMTETATRRDGSLQPWPWAVNDAGTSHWFDTRDAALRYAFQRYKQGARNFDVGCFQLNFRWHAAGLLVPRRDVRPGPERGLRGPVPQVALLRDRRLERGSRPLSLSDAGIRKPVPPDIRWPSPTGCRPRNRPCRRTGRPRRSARSAGLQRLPLRQGTARPGHLYRSQPGPARF